MTAKIASNKTLKLTSSRSALTAALVLGALILPASQAAAVSARVRMACIGDYLSYCSAHSTGSPGVRQCMRANGSRLSKTCVNALIAAGEVSKEETSRKAAALPK